MHDLLLRLAGLNSIQIALLCSFVLLQGAIFTAFPEEIVILTLGFLWSRHRISFVEAFLCVFIGLIPANIGFVFMVRKFREKLFTKRPFSWVFRPHHLERASQYVDRYGIAIVAVTRFIPQVRGIVYAACGLSQISMINFFVIDSVAAFIYIPALLLVGRTVGSSF